MSIGNQAGNQAGNLRIALAQVNPTVGDIDANADLIATQAALAHKAGAQLLVFPEMVLTGYPVEDLALRQSFRNASRIAISELAKRVANSGFGNLVMVVGYLDQIDGATKQVTKIAQETYRKSAPKPQINPSSQSSSPSPTSPTSQPTNQPGTTYTNPTSQTNVQPAKLWTLGELQASLENAAKPNEKAVIQRVFDRLRKKLNL